ncbi:MAG: hypothetical protein RSC07_00305 [Mucinivorans sp.]
MEQEKDIRGGYRVPQGYFADLESRIKEKATEIQVDNSWWGALRGVAGFAGGFVVMVLLGATFYYFAGGNEAQQSKQMATIDQFIVVDGVSQEDIMATLEPTQAEDSLSSELFALAAMEYVELTGVSLSDFEVGSEK